MFRCDRRYDGCDEKFGNLVGTKHTPSHRCRTLRETSFQIDTTYMLPADEKDETGVLSLAITAHFSSLFHPKLASF